LAGICPEGNEKETNDWTSSTLRNGIKGMNERGEEEKELP
jgi:hypothetical protein